MNLKAGKYDKTLYKNIPYLGVFATIALIMGYLESFISLPVFVVGMKLGFSNIIVLLTLYLWDFKSSLIIALMKISLSSLLFTGLNTFFYSLSGGLISLFLMGLFKKTNKFSIISISIIGAFGHNLGQVIVAMLIIENINIFYYLYPLTILSVLTGSVVGIVSKKTLKHLYFLK